MIMRLQYFSLTSVIVLFFLMVGTENLVAEQAGTDSASRVRGVVYHDQNKKSHF